MAFDCVTDANGEEGMLAEIPYQIDLPHSFVEEHMETLQTGLSTICVRGGRAIRLPNSTLPDQIVIPEGATIILTDDGVVPGNSSMEDDGLGFGNRTTLVVRVSGTTESPEESVASLEGAVFGLGNESLTNSMSAQFRRCSFSKLDFVPSPDFSQVENGVIDVQLNYALQGRGALGVMADVIDVLPSIFGIPLLPRLSFDHVVFCIARGTTFAGRANWTGFAALNGWRTVLNSGQCRSLSYLMHEISHNFGLVHAAAGVFDDIKGDTTGMVSVVLAFLLST